MGRSLHFDERLETQFFCHPTGCHPNAEEAVTKPCRPSGTRIKFPTRPSTPPSATCWAKLFRGYGSRISWLEQLSNWCSQGKAFVPSADADSYQNYGTETPRSAALPMSDQFRY